jgi:hypothetical protein
LIFVLQFSLCALALSISISLTVFLINCVKKYEWVVQFDDFREKVMQKIDENAKRPPYEWTIEQILGAIEHSNDKLHADITMADGTHVNVTKNNVIVPSRR